MFPHPFIPLVERPNKPLACHVPLFALVSFCNGGAIDGYARFPLHAKTARVDEGIVLLSVHTGKNTRQISIKFKRKNREMEGDEVYMGRPPDYHDTQGFPQASMRI